ncbi:hypothetical protein V3W47_08215 [Deinococcus sp. YIM 134068]|uniref:hypothetical protein n=1 Tax=Deinococcus lichenicola TaxID=3118910 RepID=UPI002F92DAD1
MIPVSYNGLRENATLRVHGVLGDHPKPCMTPTESVLDEGDSDGDRAVGTARGDPAGPTGAGALLCREHDLSREEVKLLIDLGNPNMLMAVPISLGSGPLRGGLGKVFAKSRRASDVPEAAQGEGESSFPPALGG